VRSTDAAPASCDVLTMSAVCSKRRDVSLRRPFRRLAIYSEHGSSIKFIDVSLKHFAADDVRKLMRVIHEQRPDLVLPKNWV
jgi:hypothetical protein